MHALVAITLLTVAAPPAYLPAQTQSPTQPAHFGLPRDAHPATAPGAAPRPTAQSFIAPASTNQPLPPLQTSPHSATGDRQVQLTHCLVSLIEDIQAPALEAGALTAVEVAEGQHVTAGQLIARIDDRQPALQKIAAKLELDAAVAKAQDDIEVRYAQAALNVAGADLERALAIEVDHGRTIQQIVVTQGIASIYSAMGQHADATELLEEALTRARDIDNRKLIAQLLNSLGEAHHELRDAVRALNHHNQAYGHAEQIGDRIEIARAATGLGDAHELAGEPGRARHYWTEALRAYTKDAAYAAFREGDLGTLEAGKLADLVVIDRNIVEGDPDAIADAKVELTMVGGRIVYERTKGEDDKSRPAP